jgi:hypothetical protein
MARLLERGQVISALFFGVVDGVDSSRFTPLRIPSRES